MHTVEHDIIDECLPNYSDLYTYVLGIILQNNLNHTFLKTFLLDNFVF